MTPRRPRRSHFVRAGLVIVGVSLLTLVIQHLGFLDRFETAGLDAFNILHTVRDPRDLVIIGISDEDYSDPALFNATSPLKCDVLRRVMAAIAAGGPTVIGVDLDTSAPGFSCLEIPTDWPPIVWAADGVRNAERRTFTEIPVLAGRGPNRARDASGLAQLPQDVDGVLRRYDRGLPLEGGREVPTFPWAVLHAGCAAGCEACCRVAPSSTPPHGETLRLNFAGERFDFQPLSVNYVLQIAEGPGGEAWRASGPLTNKIVLLGGAYRLARDRYITPVGPMAGVQILAQAIESELHGGGIRGLNEGIALALDLAAGALLVVVGYRLRDRLGLALAVSLLLVPVLCLAASYAAFSTLGLWFNFAPVVGSVLIHEVYEHVREYRRLRALHG